MTSLANGSGTLTQSYTYDSFAKQTASSGSLINPFQYTGRELDSETGLYYYRARYYDQTTGRFLGEDPMGFQAGVNFYAYTLNSPTNLIDPSGLNWQTNIKFLKDWATGSGAKQRYYRQGDAENAEMEFSPGADKMRDEFYKDGCKTIDKKQGYGTFQAFWDTVANPFYWSSTAAQVGGFAQASSINNHNGTVTFVIPNTAGTHSFFLHAVPDISSPTGPMSNIEQHFQWTEMIDTSKCGCK